MQREHLDITEVRRDGWARLTLVGELDLTTAPMLRTRLKRLQGEKVSVRLDLSKLAFMDSTGIQALVHAAHDARGNGWCFEVMRDVSPQVRRLFALAQFEPFLAGEASTEP